MLVKVKRVFVYFTGFDPGCWCLVSWTIRPLDHKVMRRYQDGVFLVLVVTFYYHPNPWMVYRNS